MPEETVANDLHTEETTKPTMTAGYLVGILDNGQPHFELVNAGNLTKILLLGIHSFGSDEVKKVTNDHENLVRKSIRSIGLGMAELLNHVEPSLDGGQVDAEGTKKASE